MTLPIIEQPLYGTVTLQTSAWNFPFTWVDRTSTVVGSIVYSEGGRVGVPGSPQVDVGTLNATLKNASTVPVVGDLVKLECDSEWVFTGYVQDVSQRVVFDNSVSYTTPITLTTIHCVDWVGYISQFQAVGAGGSHPTTGVSETDSTYQWDYRVKALNQIFGTTIGTGVITTNKTASSVDMGDTDLVGSIAQHLDLVTSTTDTIWYANHMIPLNKTTGRDYLLSIESIGGVSSSGYTFTDSAGTAGQLHYVEIDFENSTQNVANTIVANNRVRFHVPDVEVTKIGGFNEENFVVVNGSNVVGIGLDTTQQKSDATSITTYGNRQTEITCNVAVASASSGSFNLVSNPSMEYDDTGWSGSSLCVTRRRKPSLEATPFAAAHGEWAMRTRIKTATPTPPIVFSGGESDGIPVVAGSTYYLYTKAARGTNASRTDTRARARIQWINDDETVISTSYGSQVNITTAGVWYDVNTAGVVAPANAVRATVAVEFNRSGGTANFTVGDTYWADAFKFGKTTDTYFDGDSAWDATYGYLWTGGVGASPSYKVLNSIDDVADNTLTRYSTTSMRASRIRWNAQEDTTAVFLLAVGKTISLVYNGTTTTYRIIGIDGNVSPDRYMVDYYLAKV